MKCSEVDHIGQKKNKLVIHVTGCKNIQQIYIKRAEKNAGLCHIEGNVNFLKPLGKYNKILEKNAVLLNLSDTVRENARVY